MKPRHIRTLGLIVGLVAVLSMASIAASEPLSDQQVSRQIEGRLSQDSSFQNIRVAVQADVVSLSGTVPSLWAKTEALAEVSPSVCLCSGERMSCTDGAALSIAIISPVARPSISPMTLTPNVR